MSCASVMRNIDRSRYNITTVGITKEGRWLLTPATADMIEDGSWENFSFNRDCTLSVDKMHPGLIALRSDGYDILNVDCIFPILHGKNGEDGTIQGLFELAGIPYVGCSCAASACAMDKEITKRLVAPTGVKQAKFKTIRSLEFLDDPESVTKETMAYFKEFPLFVKPARAGSSVGISKAKDEASLAAAVAVALLEDDKVIVEEFIDGYEIEVAVIGNEDPVASVPGRIISSNEFYDYKAKYVDNKSELIIPADLPDEVSEEIRDSAIKVYNALGARGLSRVDFFYSKEKGIIFNEINTMPGFTPISMYPKLFAHMGIEYGDLIAYLIQLALATHEMVENDFEY